MRTARHRSIVLALTTALALILSACGGAPADPPGEPSGGDQQSDNGTTEDTDSDAAAGGTTMRVYTVPEALATDDDGSIHVSGMLIDDGSGWRLCEMVLESFPPQCGGESLTVEGVEAAEYPLEESGDVRWQTDATVVGELDGGILVVTGPAAAS